MSNYATKNYVNKRIFEEQWSSIQRSSIDFEGAVITNTMSYWNIYTPIAEDIQDQQIWSRSYQSPDGEELYSTDIRIKYIRVRLRCALGEVETTAAVSQTVRFFLIRVQESYGSANPAVCNDVDGMLRYPILYGDINGLYMDKWYYLYSRAADADTTAGGQVFISKLVKPLHSDTLLQTDSFTVEDSEKGKILFCAIGDDPDGTNSQLYGHIEIGWEFLDA